MNNNFQKATNTKLPTTGEFIKDPNGITCPVLDTNNIDFTNSVSGRKTATTRVVRATGNEITSQEFKGLKESADYIPVAGDAIFINSPTDMYVPGDEAKGRMKFDDLEKEGYKIVSGNQSEAQVKSPPAQLLVATVDSRVCIKNAWGAGDDLGNHQFLSSGATLKKGSDGKVTGIDQEGFTKWEVDPKPSVSKGPTGGTTLG